LPNFDGPDGAGAGISWGGLMDPRRARRNRFLIYSTAFVRSAATGLSGVLVGIYLARLGFSTTVIGVVVTAGLAGGALATLIATVAADAFGRRRFLFTIALLAAAGGFVVALGSNEAILAAAAFFGTLNGMGKDRGAAVAVEQAIIPSTTIDQRRTSAFAMYSVLQSAGMALGALMAGTPALIGRLGAISELDAMRAVMMVYAALMAAMALLYAALSEEVEVRLQGGAARVSPETRRVVIKLSALFALDSTGGGFLTQALVALFFAERFGVGAGTVGALFFAASVANALSQLAAPILARRIGLINTMVFTHLPANVILMVVAIAPTLPVAAALFLARECMVQMDVPARQSYVMAVVKPEERTFAAGVTGLVRLGGWAASPVLAGAMMQGLALGAPLVAGPSLKIVYDVLLYWSFRRLKPPEETAPAAATSESASSPPR
jgi:MFS family permease